MCSGARLVVVLFALAGATIPASATPRVSTVALFPVENLSGRAVPADEVRAFFGSRLVSAGIAVVPDDTLDEFMTRHRVRYAAGVDASTAAALKHETGADALLIASVELVSDLVPPKMAMFARLVALDPAPVVIWADDAGLSGDDAPGLLDLGVVSEYATLLTRTLDRLSGSLASYITTGQGYVARPSAQKFRAKIAFNGVTFDPGRTYSIAVLPFFNVAERTNAGEILAWLFIRHLAPIDAFRVTDTGEVRQQLLQGRIIMDGGVSLSDADLIGSLLEADFILGGRVLYYQDYEGPEANPRVEFSTVLIERKTRKVVWSSHSYNDGTDGVRFFGRGRSTTAHVMATQMVRLSVEQIAARRK